MEMEARNIAQRYAIFFYVKHGDIVTTTHGKIKQTFGNDAMSRARDFHWHKIFSENRTITEDEQRRRRQSATQKGDNTTRVKELFRSDRRLTVKMIADEVNMNWETVRLILTEELWMRQICYKMVPRYLRQQQRDAWLSSLCDIHMYYGDAAASFLTRSRTL